MEPFDKQYLLSVTDENELLIRLNHLITNDFNDDLIEVLLKMNSNHSNPYVKYSSAQVLIKCLTTGRIGLSYICQYKEWHCLGQMSQFLCRLRTKKPVDECLGFHLIPNEVLQRLSHLNQPTEQLCDCHCLCSICDTIISVVSHSEDSILNQILQNLFKIFKRYQKRCFIQKLINLLVIIIKQNDENIHSIETISEFIFNEKPLLERIDFSNVLHTFGGKYLSVNEEQLENDYNCDVVLLRQVTLLMLLTLSHQSSINNQEEAIKDSLDVISQCVRKICNNFDGNDWPIKLFIEEDEQLLSALHCLIGLSDSQTSHFLMDAFITSIGCDSSVLLDMLCSDEQTATLLLKLLLIYLKLTDIMTNISVNVRNVLTQLKEKMQRLTTKQLFPYNVKPLIRLLNKIS